MLLAHAPVWTFWLGFAVSILAIVSVLGLAASYFVKVVKPQYPPRSARKG